MSIRKTSETKGECLEEVSRLPGHFRLLQSAALAMSTSLDADHALDAFASHLVDLLDALGCAVWRWEPETDKLHLLRAYPPAVSARLMSRPATLEAPGCRHLRRAVERHGIQQQLLEARHGDGEGPAYWPEGAGHVLALPLVHQDRIVALVELFCRARSRSYGPEEIALAELLSSAAAATLAGSQLVQEVQQRLTEKTILQEAVAVISASLDTPTLLNHLAEHLCLAVNATSAYLLEYRGDKTSYKVVAEYVSPEAAADEKVSDLGVTYSNDEPSFAEKLEQGFYDFSYVDDPKLSDSEREHMLRYGAKSIFYIPLHVRGVPVGFAEIWESRYRRVFTPQEVELCHSIARQAGVAMEQAGLYEELRRRNAELVALHEVGRLLSSTLEMDEILDIITGQAQKLLEVESVTLALVDDEMEELVFTSTAGSADAFYRGKRLPLGTGIVGSVIDSGRPEMVSDVLGDRRHYGGFDSDSGMVTRSLLWVPLQTKNLTVGALGVFNKKDGAFGQSEVELLSSFGSVAAGAIENARLYLRARQEIGQRRRAERALEQERALLAQRVEERTEELQEANRELARAAQMKDDFLASMSHELRTPLNAILGITEGLHDQIYGPLNEKQKRSLQMVDESGRHLLALINDILDVAKIEAGQLSLSPCPTCPRQISEASLAFIREQARNKGLKLEAVFDDRVADLPADPIRLKQILINLLSNAVKFTPEGGLVGLEVQGCKERDEVLFAVWDTGIGIPDTELERLFEPFVQVDGRLDRNYTGTGLGLTIVKRLTEMHQGRVEVESEVGVGSRFTVVLPWRQGQELPTASANDGDTPGGGVHG